MLKVTVSYDHDAENPCDCDGWKLYSFGRRHAAFKQPAALGLGPIDPATGLPRITNPGLRNKLRRGLAFFLSYYEHGGCSWFLCGEQPPGVEFTWDGVKVAGLLVWEDKPDNLGPKTLDERRKDAAAFLATYTSWCNGEVYGFSIEDEAGNPVAGCYGFFDASHMFSEIVPHLSGQEYEIVGEAEWLAQQYLSQ